MKNKNILSYLFLLLSPILLYASETGGGIDAKINAVFEPVAKAFKNVILFTVPIGEHSVPFIFIILVFAGIFFTVYFSFINVKKIPLAIGVIQGKYDDLEEDNDNDAKDKSGEVSHFQALTTAVSGTIGLGNIAGVAMAVALGGPGATFWMILCGFLGMSIKFVECTLGVKYRTVAEDGTVYGGPMYYISKGLKDIGKDKLGRVVAVIFAVLCIGASFGGGNAAQSNQAANQIKSMLHITGDNAGTYIGVVIAIVVGLVIIGGIKRIAAVTEKIVPLMAGIYILACIIVLIGNASHIGSAFAQIIEGAFSPQAGLGGVIGVIIVGFQRAIFSNEAGAGSAPIAHSAVKTKYPASEGIVSLLEPFIDTVVICTMTALVIIIYNDAGIFAYGNKQVIIDGITVEGSVLTSMAFASVIPWFPYVLTIAIILFAISTMISWSYYGSQAWMFLFGKNKKVELIYKTLFLIFIVLGAAANMQAAWDFSDAMIIGLIFPNAIGLALLFPKVKEELTKYLIKIKNR